MDDFASVRGLIEGVAIVGTREIEVRPGETVEVKWTCPDEASPMTVRLVVVVVPDRAGG